MIHFTEYCNHALDTAQAMYRKWKHEHDMNKQHRANIRAGIAGIVCPHCGSPRTVKGDKTYLRNTSPQRGYSLYTRLFTCMDCKRRFERIFRDDD